jgi:glycosyltransferase involved in cell wall biosynthesis
LVAIHQFIPSFTAGSAVGTHALQVTAVLREMGIDTRTWVGESRGVPRREVSSYRRFRGASDPNAFLLYQLSTGSLMADFVQQRPEPKIVNYHNVTPASYMDPWEPLLVPELVEGRHQLTRLAPVTDLGIGVSEYNTTEMEDAGYAKASVAPFLADYDQLGGVSDPAVEERLRRAKAGGGADWLFVGRVSPHKCHHDVVKAFAAYRRVYDPRARLWFVGGSASHLYLTTLGKYAAALGLADAVHLVGSVPQSTLVAHFRTADVYVCLSEHEGFCVPLLEAMWHAVPVVAYRAAAVPETLGDPPAGVLLDDKTPSMVAAAVHRVVTDEAVRDQLVAAGRRRVEHYSIVRTRARFREVIEGLVG